eukprot:226517-Hanusia_phi.AAC.2
MGPDSPGPARRAMIGSPDSDAGDDACQTVTVPGQPRTRLRGLAAGPGRLEDRSLVGSETRRTVPGTVSRVTRGPGTRRRYGKPHCQ